MDDVTAEEYDYVDEMGRLKIDPTEDGNNKNSESQLFPP